MNYSEFAQQASLVALPKMLETFTTIEGMTASAAVHAIALADEMVKRGLLEPAKPSAITIADIKQAIFDYTVHTGAEVKYSEQNDAVAKVVLALGELERIVLQQPVESAPAKITEADIVPKAVFKDGEGDIRVVIDVQNYAAKYILAIEGSDAPVGVRVEDFVSMLNGASAIRIA